MLNDLALYLDLTPFALVALTVITFCAGVVRGFTGFALSAVIMSIGVLFIAPVALIPMMWWLEMTASALMVRGGWAEANRRIAFILTMGSAVGLIIGLQFTTRVDPEISQLVALVLLISLAVLQLAKVRMSFLATTPGLVGSGLTAGIATGLAGVGGMVVALYVLSQQIKARVMRATLVMYLFVSLIVGFGTHVVVGTMTMQAVTRGLAFALPTALGVISGQMLFNPGFEAYYKPVCLVLLIGLATLSLIRVAMT